MKTGAPYTAWLTNQPLHKDCIARIQFLEGQIANVVEATDGRVIARNFLWASESWDKEEAWTEASSKFKVPENYIHKEHSDGISVWKHPILDEGISVLDAVTAISRSPHGTVMVSSLKDMDGYSIRYSESRNADELLRAGFVLGKYDGWSHLSALRRDPGMARGILKRRLRRKISQTISAKKARALREQRAVESGSLDPKMINSLIKILLRGRDGKPSTRTTDYLGPLVWCPVVKQGSVINNRCQALLRAVNFAKNVTGLLVPLKNDETYRKLIKEASRYVPGMKDAVKKKIDEDLHISDYTYTKKAVSFLRGEAKRCRIKQK